MFQILKTKTFLRIIILHMFSEVIMITMNTIYIRNAIIEPSIKHNI